MAGHVPLTGRGSCRRPHPRRPRSSTGTTRISTRPRTSTGTRRSPFRERRAATMIFPSAPVRWPRCAVPGQQDGGKQSVCTGMGGRLRRIRATSKGPRLPLSPPVNQTPARSPAAPRPGQAAGESVPVLAETSLTQVAMQDIRQLTDLRREVQRWFRRAVRASVHSVMV